MSGYGIFESVSSDGFEQKDREAAAAKDLAVAMDRVAERFGPYLDIATDRQDFNDRVAFVKPEMMKVVDAAGVMPVAGVMRKVVGRQKTLWQKAKAAAYGDNDGPSAYDDPSQWSTETLLRMNKSFRRELEDGYDVDRTKKTLIEINKALTNRGASKTAGFDDTQSLIAEFEAAREIWLNSGKLRPDDYTAQIHREIVERAWGGDQVAKNWIGRDASKTINAGEWDRDNPWGFGSGSPSDKRLDKYDRKHEDDLQRQWDRTDATGLFEEEDAEKFGDENWDFGPPMTSEEIALQNKRMFGSNGSTAPDPHSSYYSRRLFAQLLSQGCPRAEAINRVTSSLLLKMSASKHKTGGLDEFFDELNRTAGNGPNGTSDDFYDVAPGYEYDDPYQRGGWTMDRADDDGGAAWSHPSGYSVSGREGPTGGSWQLYDQSGKNLGTWDDAADAQRAIGRFSSHTTGGKDYGQSLDPGGPSSSGDFAFDDSELIPEDNWDGYLNEQETEDTQKIRNQFASKTAMTLDEAVAWVADLNGPGDWVDSVETLSKMQGISEEEAERLLGNYIEQGKLGRRKQAEGDPWKIAPEVTGYCRTCGSSGEDTGLADGRETCKNCGATKTASRKAAGTTTEDGNKLGVCDNCGTVDVPLKGGVCSTCQKYASKTVTASVADDLVVGAKRWFLDQIDREDGHDWTSYDSFQSYLAMLRSGTAWKVSDTEVVATVEPGTVWGNAAADALDSAADGVLAFGNGNITQIDSDRASLTWDNSITATRTDDDFQARRATADRSFVAAVLTGGDKSDEDQDWWEGGDDDPDDDGWTPDRESRKTAAPDQGETDYYDNLDDKAFVNQESDPGAWDGTSTAKPAF